jgi:hypothetical protein
MQLTHTASYTAACMLCQEPPGAVQAASCVVLSQLRQSVMQPSWQRCTERRQSIHVAQLQGFHEAASKVRSCAMLCEGPAMRCTAYAHRMP